VSISDICVVKTSQFGDRDCNLLLMLLTLVYM